MFFKRMLLTFCVASLLLQKLNVHVTGIKGVAQFNQKLCNSISNFFSFQAVATFSERSCCDTRMAGKSLFVNKSMINKCTYM